MSTISRSIRCVKVSGAINSAGSRQTLSSFLVPASLVYSLVWGFALQDAFSKFDLTDATTKRHLSVLRHIRELLMRSRAIADEEKAMILQKLATCTIQWMERQMGKKNECKGRLDASEN